MRTYIWVGCPRLSRMLLQPRDGSDGTMGACCVVLVRMRPCKKLGNVSGRPRRLLAAKYHQQSCTGKKPTQSITYVLKMNN